MLIIPISENGKKYGYLTWTSSYHDKMQSLLKNISRVHVYFQDFDLGWKNVDWKYHRISLGRKWTTRIPDDKSKYILEFKEKDILKVRWE